MEKDEKAESPMVLGPYILGPGGPNVGIYQGDSRELSKAVPDESIDLIFTDPVHHNIDDYRWLAETAARVLKPDSACLVWCDNRTVIDCAVIMRSTLNFERILTVFMSGITVGRYIGRTFVKTALCLWMTKGKAQPRHMIWDISIGVSNIRKYGNYHLWGKDPMTISRWLDAFCKPGAIVADFFSGGGTVAAVCKQLCRRYLAFEIDPETAELARERVRNTQPPLFTLKHEQLCLSEGDGDE